MYSRELYMSNSESLHVQSMTKYPYMITLKHVDLKTVVSSKQNIPDILWNDMCMIQGCSSHSFLYWISIPIIDFIDNLPISKHITSMKHTTYISFILINFLCFKSDTCLQSLWGKLKLVPKQVLFYKLFYFTSLMFGKRIKHLNKLFDENLQ